MTTRISHKEVTRFLEDNGFKFISGNETTKSKTVFSDSQGYKYTLILSTLKYSLSKNRKPSRFHKSNEETIGNIKNWLKINNKKISLYGRNTFIDSAKNNLIFICDKCFHKFKTSWNCMQCGKLCPVCNVIDAGIKKRLPIEQVEKIFLNSSVSPVNINEYNGFGEYMDVSCDYCGHIWEMTFGNVKIGNGCPKCKVSKGEKSIINAMEKYGIEYSMQKTFDKCFYNRKLKFDFFIDSKNIAIEYNGLQHYKIVEFSSSPERNAEEFRKVKIRDKIKVDYCKNNNIRLITISYKKFNEIDSIIKTIKMEDFK